MKATIYTVTLINHITLVDVPAYEIESAADTLEEMFGLLEYAKIDEINGIVELRCLVSIRD